MDKIEKKKLETLYREMYLPLCNYAVSALGNYHLAEEAVQDTFRIACNKAEELFNSGNQKGWITNTLKNVIRNIRKNQAITNNLVINALSIDDMEIEAQNDEISFNVVYENLLGQEDFDLLSKIVLKRYTMLEAASELNISVEACKKRVQRAKKRLRELLNENNKA